MMGVFVQVNEEAQRGDTQPIGYVIQENGCWEWAGCTDNKGYGQMWVEGQTRQAHRVVYERACGPVDRGGGGVTARVCSMCQFCWRQDYGYSNWTTEGTMFECLKGLNPALDGQEEPWRDVSPELAAALDVALTCPSFLAGVPAHTDVDMEAIPYRGANVEHCMAYTDNVEAAGLLFRRIVDKGSRG